MSMIRDTKAEMQSGMSFKSTTCAGVIFLLIGFVVAIIGFLVVIFVIGHVLWVWDIMSVRTESRGTSVLVNKLSSGVVGLCVVMLVTIIIGFIVYGLYSTFCDSLEATQQELDIERQQTASD